MYHECVQSSGDAAVSSKFKNLRSAKHRFETLVTPLSRAILDLTSYIAFANKLAVARKGTTEGNVGKTFLETINVTFVLLLAMMADAGMEALNLIRFLDDEEVSIGEICHRVIAFLDHVTWLFHDEGCFKVSGHVAFVIEWLSKPHFYMVDGEGRCIGGSGISESAKQEAFAHMRAWTLLAREVLSAEFPDFDLVDAFSVLALPKQRYVDRLDLREGDRMRLDRLAKAFSQPAFPEEYTNYLPFAIAAYSQTNFKCSYADAWKAAIANRQSMHPSGALSAVLLRFTCFSPATSKIEQSFALVLQRASVQRLNGTDASESRMIALLVADLNEAEIENLCEVAAGIWTRAFPLKMVKVHKRKRLDANIPRRRRQPRDIGTSVTERAFLKRAHAQIAASAPSGIHQRLDTYVPELWTESHTKEREFQRGKRQRRLVQAHMDNLTLPTETTDELNQITQTEHKRRLASFASRQSSAARLRATLQAAPPREGELHGITLFLDDGVVLPHDFHALVHRRGARIVTDAHAAKMFLAMSPWKVNNF